MTSSVCGIKVSAISLGTWYLPRSGERDEYGIYKIDVDETKRVFKLAYDVGINFIDTANRYHGAVSPVPLTHVGYAERLIGRIIYELGLEREFFVIATKVAGEMASWPNASGLSRKHIMWQIRESLKRLQMEYVDVYYAHRFDPEVPKRETLSTFNDLVRFGYIRYVGVSNISAHDLVEYQMIANMCGYEPVSFLQYKYNWLERDIEKDIIPIARKFGMVLTVYSPLAQGLLTGKYVDTLKKQWIVPSMSRGEISDGVRKMFTDENLKKLHLFMEFAKSMNVSPTQLAIAWILHKSVHLEVPIVPIVSVSNAKQLEEIVSSLDVKLGSDDLEYLDGVAIENV
ncbi:MAG: aldo/keto reductase [Ignisphaera sp.]|nr:aldo/keto reductase [Ignisphaera sp.]MCX8167730.1 aldo/keto reductase [Ignisphaera sp.]MDW8085294.1 aldo/keto reductase [Ignisphaera sp.]